MCPAWWCAPSCHGVPLASPWRASIVRPCSAPHALDVGLQTLVTLGALTAQLRIALTCCVAPVTRRGHLQHPADGLDPVVITVTVDVGLHDLSRRSSSACAKNALAVFRMSLARHNSLTSRSSSLMRWASDVVVPGRWPLSTSAFLTQSFKV